MLTSALLYVCKTALSDRIGKPIRKFRRRLPLFGDIIVVRQLLFGARQWGFFLGGYRIVPQRADGPETRISSSCGRIRGWGP
jgi:hypothetical protein